ncbi:carbohydrate ABC transporter membrane protein 2, CUT1 family (TC 3.A.1.1.-) [Marinitoga hydrogenitolerans DSM 16785]|uniref:Carbohydrate ABC transporter membrane protein 2, CUT1 family (TC 3.A.1.1.-) n=1 Tax=Marinitoga hydrogenitolerans (strain DSM 16785 / JCM 12826 / AT1271) TaxID=1122195 RepID=A0A1M4SY04_MARH1|nr:carbohydrate ABC transporter permease [Marinitoga hydrogenitolerans]SHE37091.1 carbohydrate ABC transporter membrane protein 2, CUT1 family (TC 3.A.1.1.-) [Marinitoga hydrogenitolerans DSM 16785]
MVKKKSFLRTFIFWFLITLLVVFITYPFAWMLSVSFRYDTDAFEPGIIPERPTLETYAILLGFKKSLREELSNEQQQLLEIIKTLPKEQQEAVLSQITAQRKKESFPFLRFFRNSLVIAGLSALVSLILSIFGAYAFSRIDFKGRGTIQRGVLIVYLFGGTILAVPLYQIFVKIGLTSSGFKSAIALFIIYIVQTIPVSLYMLGNYFRTIPRSIEEAAIIDGTTRMGVITKIIIPLSLPAIITVYIYAFMIAWNEFLFASIFVRPFPEFYTLPLGLNEIFNSEHAIWAKMMAASVVTAIPVVALFMMMEKYLTGGLTAGGVKE